MKGFVEYQLSLFYHCSHRELQYQALKSSIPHEASDAVEYLLDFPRKGISSQVFESSCMQLNVQVDENVYRERFNRL